MSTPTRHVYRLHGLTLASPWPLSAPRSDGSADFEVTFGGERDTREAVDAALLAEGKPPLGRSKAFADWPRPGNATIRFEGVAEFEVDSRTGRISAWAHPGADHGLLPILLEGNVVAFVLGLRGEPMLHAAAVTFGGCDALALAGPSGQGKTTAAAMLCASGARLLTDDAARLEFGDRVLLHPGTTTLRLRPNASGVAGWFPGAARDESVDGRTRIWAQAVSVPLPLSAIVVPAPERGARRVAVEPMRAAAATAAILGAARFGSWTDPDRLRDHLDLAARLGSSVPAYRVRVPWGPPFERSIADEFAECLRGLEHG